MVQLGFFAPAPNQHHSRDPHDWVSRNRVAHITYHGYWSWYEARDRHGELVHWESPCNVCQVHVRQLNTKTEYALTRQGAPPEYFDELEAAMLRGRDLLVGELTTHGAVVQAFEAGELSPTQLAMYSTTWLLELLELVDEASELALEVRRWVRTRQTEPPFHHGLGRGARVLMYPRSCVDVRTVPHSVFASIRRS